ncbi:hypothetical protein T484DRAFT_1854232, partial [Baffinella frigidus]
MADELRSFLQLISETDGDVVDGGVEATRKPRPKSVMNQKLWDDFYNKVALQDGTVTATTVIDFEYSGTVERMYCFDDGCTDRVGDGCVDRVVLHVHTLEPWPTDAADVDPATRARKVTSVNLRRSPQTKDGTTFKQEIVTGYELLNVGDWKDRVKKGKGHETEWSWATEGDVPWAEKKLRAGGGLRVEPKRQRAYDQVRKVIQLGEQLLQRKNVLRLTCGGGTDGRSGKGGHFFFTARRVGEGAGVEGVVAEAMRELGDIECVVLEGGDMQAVAALRFQLLHVHVPFVVSWLEPEPPAEARDGFWEAFAETLTRGSCAGAISGSALHAAFSAACAWLETHGGGEQGGGGAAAAAAIPFRVLMMWCCAGGVPVTPNIRFSSGASVLDLALQDFRSHLMAMQTIDASLAPRLAAAQDHAHQDFLNA